MRLYYMTSECWGLVILKERRLKLSTIPELNDPFELLGASIGEKNIRCIMARLHDHWSKDMGMICLTDNWHSPVMWAHYAEKHNGLCLGFDMPDDPSTIFKVDYKPDRLQNMLDIKKGLCGVDQEMIEKLLTTKYQDWSYEREYRLFAELNDKEQNGLYYLPFGKDLILREVILGARCKLSVAEVAEAVVKQQHSVHVIQAEPALNSFAIIQKKTVRSIDIKAGLSQ